MGLGKGGRVIYAEFPLLVPGEEMILPPTFPYLSYLSYLTIPYRDRSIPFHSILSQHSTDIPTLSFFSISKG